MHPARRWPASGQTLFDLYGDCFVKQDPKELYCVLPDCGPDRVKSIASGDFTNFGKHLARYEDAGFDDLEAEAAERGERGEEAAAPEDDVEGIDEE